MTDPVLAPVTAQQRLETLDLLRGFALCGILLMNIMFMGDSRVLPPLPAVRGSPDWTIWFIQSVGIEGTMRGLFTLLFGAGILLLTSRKEGTSPDVYFRRCLMLMALGVVNVVVFLFPGDVLFSYGLTGLFLFVFRNARPLRLLIIAGVIILALSAKSVADLRPPALELRQAHALVDARAAGRVLTAEEQEKAGTWTAAVERLARESPRAKKAREQRTGGWLSVLGWSWGWWTTTTGGYLVDVVAESAAFMLVGMALFKLGVTGGERSWRVYALMAAGGYAIGLPLNIWQVVTWWNSGFAPDVWIIWSTYQIDRLAMTIGHLGVILLLWKAGALAWTSGALKAIGRLGLTNYLGQSALAAVFFYGFGMWDRLSWIALWGVCVAVWVIQAVFSVLYLRRFAIGPAEWLLRSVAYGRPQPLRVTSPTPV
ncbi:DUF418 domain-containing protein [Brevundimonas sp.]|uniref:DUF418 domain-containing protein n=1 Tax=Brevundimonas sp. TaxID=1871086 RepID=UPI002FCA1CED